MIAWMKDFVACTAEDVKRPWCGGANGKWFRCCFCGHKFVTGDLFRAIFTNDGSSTGGNPFTCKSCFDEHDGESGLKKEWKRLNELVKVKFWWTQK